MTTTISETKDPVGESQKYEAKIDSLIEVIKKIKLEGAEITPSDVVYGLDLSKNNKKMKKWATDNLDMTAKEFEQAIHRLQVSTAIGSSYPYTPSEYVATMMKRRGTSVSFNGVVSEPGERYADFTHIMACLRDEAVSLHLPFSREGINDATDIWFTERKKERLGILRDAVRYDPAMKEKGDAALRRIAETCFKDDPALVVASIQKFIQQVKGKMAGRLIERHLMIVLLGLTGGGKSTFVKELISPLEEVMVGCTLIDIASERMIDMWRNFIGFCDEMVGGNRADNNSLKHAITTATMDRRPMRTNKMMVVPQNLTFIGTSNASEFQEIIRDETGTRRYFALNCQDMLDWDVINSTDWLAVWQSVDETAADPMLPFLADLKLIQESQREKSTVEVWLDQLDPMKEFALSDGKRIEGKRLYTAYREYEKEVFPRLDTNIVWFGRKLSAIKNCPFSHTAKNGIWLYTETER